MRILSGIQPSGTLHLGNYFGMMRPAIELQEKGEAFYFVADYHALGTEPGACHHCHTGRCPVGITTQDPALESRLDVEEGARRVRNFLTVLTMEAQTLARACGKSHLHNLEPEDLAALTVEAAAMAGVPLAGTDWIPGKHAY